MISAQLSAASKYLERCSSASQALSVTLRKTPSAITFLETDSEVDIAATVDNDEDLFVTLGYRRSEWTGHCDCEKGEFCGHCHAVLTRWVEERKAATADKHPQEKLQPKSASAFEREITAKIGRALQSHELRTVRAIERLWLQNTHAPYVVSRNWLSAYLEAPWSARDYDLWEVRPANAWEAWLHLAFVLRKLLIEPPEFLAKITAQKEVELAVAPTLRVRAVHEWKRRFARLVSRPVEEEAPVELRAMIGDDELTLQMQNSAGLWKPLKASQTREFYLAAHRLLGESLLLVRILLPTYCTTTQLSLRRDGDAKLIHRAVACDLLRSRIVTAAGKPYLRSPEKLTWSIAFAEKSEEYRFTLALPDGSPLKPPHSALRGNPCFYLTEDTIYEGPPSPEFDEIESAIRFSVPAGAIESSEGADFLAHLKAPIPPRLAERMEIIRPTITVQARLAARSSISSGEVMQVELSAAWAELGARKIYRNGVWVGKEAPKARPSGAEGKIYRYDDAVMYESPGVIANLQGVWNPHEQVWEKAVRKNFAEFFSEWLLTLPPQIELQLDRELATLREEAISGSIRLEAEPAGVDWFDLRVVVDLPEIKFTEEELAALLGARGGWVRLGHKGWQRLAVQLTREENEMLADLGLAPQDLMSAEAQRLHALQLSRPAAAHLLPKDQAAEIRALQLQKRALAADVLGEEAFARALTLDDLRTLLEEPASVVTD